MNNLNNKNNWIIKSVILHKTDEATTAVQSISENIDCSVRHIMPLFITVLNINPDDLVGKSEADAMCIYGSHFDEIIRELEVLYESSHPIYHSKCGLKYFDYIGLVKHINFLIYMCALDNETYIKLINVLKVNGYDVKLSPAIDKYSDYGTIQKIGDDRILKIY